MKQQSKLKIAQILSWAEAKPFSVGVGTHSQLVFEVRQRVQSGKDPEHKKKVLSQHSHKWKTQTQKPLYIRQQIC
jgi:hypothetical protein